MFIGQNISIFLGGAACSSAVVVEVLHGTVANVTEKAVQVQTDHGSIWFPRKALLPPYSTGGSYRLAKWFKPSGYQRYVMEKAVSVSGISAA